jgi:very-short-patch-repair endonuclease
MRAGVLPLKSPAGGTALIAVLKAPRDLEIAARQHWYRIPLNKAPKSAFTHIAFYQPACFKPQGKRIAYYAEVAGCAAARRVDIFPDEPLHPAADRLYLKYSLGPLRALRRPILNTSGTRVTFGYAPLPRLARAGDILGVFNAVSLENLLRGALEAAGMPFLREHNIMRAGKLKYRLDFALFCLKGRLDVECDGRRCHYSPGRHCRDTLRDNWLKRRGWTTLRFGEHELLGSLRVCLREIKKAVRLLGGLKSRLAAPTG